MATDEFTSESSLPVLVRMRRVSVEIYQNTRADEHDDVIVIDLNPPTGEIPRGYIRDATRGEKAALPDRGMSSYRAVRSARAAGGVVNIYI